MLQPCLFCQSSKSHLLPCQKYCVEDARKISSEIYLSFTHSVVYLSLTQQLNPKDMVNNKTDSVKILIKVINKLYDKHLSSKESDNAKLQYEEFINDVSRYQEDFLNFDVVNGCLDQFFQKFLNSLDKYKNLWKEMQIIFVIPNGQGQIERGFSINKEMVIENLQAD